MTLINKSYRSFSCFGIVGDDGFPKLDLQIDIIRFRVSETMPRPKQKTVTLAVPRIKMRRIYVNDSKVETLCSVIIPRPFPPRRFTN
jgi:hypothetical protein